MSSTDIRSGRRGALLPDEVIPMVSSQEFLRRQMLLERALIRGDLDDVRAILDYPEDFPNVENHPLVHTDLLVSAIWLSPIHAVEQLLVLGADPNRKAIDGFPALYSAVVDGREDRLERLSLLLAHGADPNQRGINDFTALHAAAQAGDVAMVELLLSAGADPTLRTRIDDLELPATTAAEAGHADLATRLERAARDHTS